MENFINPCKGRISSKFGNRVHPVSKKTSFHNGVDIAVIVGTPVLAPADGIITEVWNHEKGGKSLAMVSKSGVRFGFAHLSYQLGTKGQKVKSGELIARTGNTGASTGPHLHFTVKIAGVFVDPTMYFTFM